MRILKQQSEAQIPVTEHILELAFTKVTVEAAASGKLHGKIELAEHNKFYPGLIDPAFFTTTIQMHLNNPPALPEDTSGLTQPSRRLMWVLGTRKFEDHFVVAEDAINSVKVRVSVSNIIQIPDFD
jgi:hypothetical protein